MLRVLAGMVTGVAVSGAVMGAASVVVDLSERQARREAAPEAGAVRVPTGSGFGAAREDREAALPRVGDGPAPVPAPRMSMPAPDASETLQDLDTAPSRSPGIGAAPSLVAPPESDAAGLAPRGAQAPASSGRAPVPAPPAVSVPEAPAAPAER